jgi:hypothetical protein
MRFRSVTLHQEQPSNPQHCIIEKNTEYSNYGDILLDKSVAVDIFPAKIGRNTKE